MSGDSGGRLAVRYDPEPKLDHGFWEGGKTTLLRRIYMPLEGQNVLSLVLLPDPTNRGSVEDLTVRGIPRKPHLWRNNRM